MGTDIQFSFLHSLHKSKLLNQQKCLLAVIGFERGTPIELDTASAHKTNKKISVPQFKAIIDCDTISEVKDIPTSANKDTKIRNPALILPSF